MVDINELKARLNAVRELGKKGAGDGMSPSELADCKNYCVDSIAKNIEDTIREGDGRYRFRFYKKDGVIPSLVSQVINEFDGYGFVTSVENSYKETDENGYQQHNVYIWTIRD